MPSTLLRLPMLLVLNRTYVELRLYEIDGTELVSAILNRTYVELRPTRKDI